MFKGINVNGIHMQYYSNNVLVAITYISGSTHVYQGLNVETKVRAEDREKDANESNYGK